VGAYNPRVDVSQGNLVHLVTHQRLECQLGWAGVMGRGDVFYSSLVVDAPYVAPAGPLPTMPPPATGFPSPVAPTLTPEEGGLAPSPAPTNAPGATDLPAASLSGQTASGGWWAANPMLPGLILTVLIMGAIIAWRLVAKRRW
jgi:hypothetical protein